MIERYDRAAVGMYFDVGDLFIATFLSDLITSCLGGLFLALYFEKSSLNTFFF